MYLIEIAKGRTNEYLTWALHGKETGEEKKNIHTYAASRGDV